MESNKANVKRVRSKTSYLCALCGKKFKTKSNLNSHTKKIHPEFVSIKKTTLKCPQCLEQLTTYSELDKHLQSQHGVAIIHETKEFDSMDSFKNWKLNFEKETVSYFICLNSKRSGEKKVIKYICHRSGTYIPKIKGTTRKRQLKLIQSNKIGGHCSARITVTLTTKKKTNKEKILVDFVSTHVGHSMEVERLPLPKPEREEIAKNLMEGIQSHNILQDIHQAFDPTRKISYLTNKDLNNIKVQCNVKSDVIFHSDDAKRVGSLVEKYQNSLDNPVLYYKPYGLEDSQMTDNDFIITFMNSTQEEMLSKYGNQTLIVNPTHGTNPYKIQLTALMVLDEQFEGFPVAFLWSNSQTELVYKKFFSCIKEKVPDLKPKIFMSDDCNTFYNAFTKVYNNFPNKLLCDWHVKRRCFDNLSKISSPQKQKQVKSDIKILVNEPNIVKFENLLSAFINDLMKDPDTKTYGQYFNTYANRRAQWAHCYRKDFQRHTNISLEKWHQELRRNAVIGGRCHRRPDVSINNVIEYLEMKLVERRVSSPHYKVPNKLSELRKRHKLADKIADETPIFEQIPNTTWLVAASTNKKSSQVMECYQVGVSDITECTCSFICNECQACLHMFSCTCHDYINEHNMCEHIHLVCKQFPHVCKLTVASLESDIVYYNSEDNDEMEVISTHFQETTKNLYSEKTLAMDAQQELSTLLANCNNIEAIRYAHQNMRLIISRIHAMETE